MPSSDERTCLKSKACLQIAVDDFLRKRGGKERLKYMTHVSTALSACKPDTMSYYFLTDLALQSTRICVMSICRGGKSPAD